MVPTVVDYENRRSIHEYEVNYKIYLFLFSLQFDYYFILPFFIIGNFSALRKLKYFLYAWDVYIIFNKRNNSLYIV